MRQQSIGPCFESGHFHCFSPNFSNEKSEVREKCWVSVRCNPCLHCLGKACWQQRLARSHQESPRQSLNTLLSVSTISLCSPINNEPLKTDNWTSTYIWVPPAVLIVWQWWGLQLGFPLVSIIIFSTDFAAPTSREKIGSLYQQF